MQKYTLTEADMKRYIVLKRVIEGSLTLKDASELLGLSYRHTIRLKQKVMKYGLDGILRKPPPKPPNLKFDSSLIRQIIKLRRELYYERPVKKNVSDLILHSSSRYLKANICLIS